MLFVLARDMGIPPRRLRAELTNLEFQGLCELYTTEAREHARAVSRGGNSAKLR